MFNQIMAISYLLNDLMDNDHVLGVMTNNFDDQVGVHISDELFFELADGQKVYKKEYNLDKVKLYFYLGHTKIFCLATAPTVAERS